MSLQPCPTPDYSISLEDQIGILGDEYYQKFVGLFVSLDMPQEEIDKLRINENKDIYQLNFKTGKMNVFPRPRFIYLKEV